MVDIFSVLNKQVCPRTLIACRLQLGQASVNPHAWKAEVPYKLGGVTLANPAQQEYWITGFLMNIAMSSCWISKY